MSAREEAKRPTCDTPGCRRPIPKGGEGHPEICPTCLTAARLYGRPPPDPLPIPIRLGCPGCGVGRRISATIEVQS